MRKIEKPVEIEQGDSFKVILSKYGALGLDKQENLSELIGDLEGQLDIEKGVLTFSDDISFNVQILGFFNEEPSQATVNKDYPSLAVKILWFLCPGSL